MKKQNAPLFIKIDPATGARELALVMKIRLIAKTNALSPTDIARLALSAGMPMVETKMAELLADSEKSGGTAGHARLDPEAVGK